MALALALTLLAWPALSPQAQGTPQRLPALGDAVSDGFDLNQERRLGERIMRDLRRDPDYLDDPLLSEYVSTLSGLLLRAARQQASLDPEQDRAFAWQTFLVRDRAINAFALPGGYVGVYLGLIAMTATPDELVSVLAHEWTHVTQRHIARGQDNASQQGMATMAAMLLGVLAASRAGDMQAVQASIVGSQAVMAQGQLNFSRDMEREADRIGLALMDGAGFAATGMSGMFEKLDSSSRLNDSGLFPYLRSHPLTSERVSEAKLRAMDAAAPATPRISAAEHAVMQARARVLMDGRDPSLRRLQALGQPGSPAVDTGRLGALYSAALASVRLGEFGKAQIALEAGSALAQARFSQDARVSRAFTLLAAEAATEQALRTQEASTATRLRAAASWRPTGAGRPELLARAAAARALQALGEPGAATALRAATEDLQVWVAEQRLDAGAWQALAQCADLLGLRLRALRAGGEAAWALGDLSGAVDRFRAAQAEARRAGPEQYQEVRVIESRLREVEQARRQQIAEWRGE